MHDISKFSPSEFIRYANFFFNPDGTRRKGLPTSANKCSGDDLDYGWLFHQNRNKHHWQFWILINDEEEPKVLDMPEVYIKEMICDWKGAGKAQGTNPDGSWEEVATYYLKNKDKVIFSQNTNDLFTKILGAKLEAEGVSLSL